MEVENAITKIINCAYTVHKQLSIGFAENVYKNAMVIEMREQGLSVKTEMPFEVMYKGRVVGSYRADIVVEDKVILELKAVHSLAVAHEIQLVNYLTALHIDYGLLINFGSELIAIKRKFRTYRKAH